MDSGIDRSVLHDPTLASIPSSSRPVGAGPGEGVTTILRRTERVANYESPERLKIVATLAPTVLASPQLRWNRSPRMTRIKIDSPQPTFRLAAGVWGHFNDSRIVELYNSRRGWGGAFPRAPRPRANNLPSRPWILPPPAPFTPLEITKKAAAPTHLWIDRRERTTRQTAQCSGPLPPCRVEGVGGHLQENVSSPHDARRQHRSPMVGAVTATTDAHETLFSGKPPSDPTPSYTTSPPQTTSTRSV